MTELEKAARMALEALQKAVPKDAKQAREQLGAITALTQALATTERKGEPVVPTDLGAWLWVKLADYCRRKGLNPHHENDLFNLAGELRSMLAHTSPQVPEDVMSVLSAIHRRPSDAGIWLDDLTRIIRAARKGE